ncbi:MAG: TIGR03009 domain-containing protein [Planctomycetaceae bacterium]|nr:MAG: TIGR03009 domain-containing protein [Planctomycetaceae bacterium]
MMRSTAVMLTFCLLTQAQLAPKAPGQPQGGQAAPTRQAAAPAAPFTLSPTEQSEMDQLLLAWEKQSVGTKQLEAKFRRWHFDLLAAPAGVHATWAEGMVKYSAPDKGLFQVSQLKFFSGIVDGKPTYKSHEGQFGEHWVCNGQELLEFDHARKECRIQQLPPDLQGKEILESPLPFVFNLNAEKIKQRYWIRRIDAPAGVYVLEAHPKRQADRAQYRFVRIVINDQSFLPQALILYGPNFDPVNSPGYDHYEFTDVERNSIRQGLANWGRVFIAQRPPADWKVIRETYRPIEPGPQVAQPNGEKTLR